MLSIWNLKPNNFRRDYVTYIAKDSECSNVYRKGNGIKFYRFPNDTERKAKWIAAVKRENWTPSQHTV